METGRVHRALNYAMHATKKGRAQAYRPARYRTRAIWLKLDCLNPNLQQVKRSSRRKRRLKPVPHPALASSQGQHTLRDAGRRPVRTLKEMSGELTSRCDVLQGRKRDHLRGARPMVIIAGELCAGKLQPAEFGSGGKVRTRGRYLEDANEAPVVMKARPVRHGRGGLCARSSVRPAAADVASEFVREGVSR
jgi:hypothetical protein